jgi:CubicO group peptidase (beta-lactamase class C family)
MVAAATANQEIRDMGFDGTGIDQLLAGAVDAGTYSGVAALVVDRGGVLYHGMAGDAGPSTMFRNASMTKALATAGALALVEQGRLDLGAKVESILPEFGELEVLVGFDGDIPRLRAPKTKATIQQLATHTAGCGYFFLNEDLRRYAELTGLPSPLSGLKASLMGPLARDPGTMWEYGVNSDWLGLVVEAVSGQKLDAYLAEHVFAPLGMVDTTFSPTDEQRARLMPIKARTPDGGLVAVDLDVAPDPEWASAGHGSYGTVTDYGCFIRAMLNDGEHDGIHILSADTVELAFSDQIKGISMPELTKSADHTLSNDVPALPVPQGWGLGFHLFNVDLPGMRSAGSGDWAGIFNCFYWIDRTAGVGAAIMTQVLPFFDAAIVQTLLEFEAAVYAQVGSAAAAR